MYRFCSIKYIVVTANITALLFIIGMLSGSIFKLMLPVLKGSTIHLFDALFMPFCAYFPGPMLLFSGSIAALLFDIALGGIHYIPVSIIIRIMMFFVIKLFTTKWWYSTFISFFIASTCLVTGYSCWNFYYYDINDAIAMMIIFDIIQATFAYIIAIIIYYYISHRYSQLWND